LIFFGSPNWKTYFAWIKVHSCSVMKHNQGFVYEFFVYPINILFSTNHSIIENWPWFLFIIFIQIFSSSHLKWIFVTSFTTLFYFSQIKLHTFNNSYFSHIFVRILNYYLWDLKKLKIKYKINFKNLKVLK